MESERVTAAAAGGDENRRASDRTERLSSGWWNILKRTWAEAGQDNLSLVASGIAFNAFLAFVPLLTAVVLTYGLVAEPEQVARHIAALARMMPQDAASLLGEQLESLVESSGSAAGLGLLLALAIAIYGAMRGASGIITGLNIVFNVKESRSFVRQTAMALAITTGLVLMFIAASLGISAMGFLEDLLPSLGGAVHFLLQVLVWIAAALLVSLVIACIYRYAPARRAPKWRWLTPGSAAATILWILATLAFGFYVRNFGSYNATYGSLGAVIIFLTWLYLSAYILLLCGELNQVVERRVGADDTRASQAEHALR